MNPLTFYLSKEVVKHSVNLDTSYDDVLGQPAYVPGLPGLGFYYRQHPERYPFGPKHVLTDEKTGLVAAEASTRPELHRVLGRLIAKHGLAGFVAAHHREAHRLAKALYFISCTPPRKRKPRAATRAGNKS